ncbi:glycosyl hydrolase family 18 protein [Streptomyces sp. RB6PN25]|uniref:chitinase n=1 Tax=Streptomyces humicola TaxID=2953240 RepID=A0ABT1PNM5_9ACTN|nr:glycosyl hydrolase family 18 protein [Streptomyces humicola]MCQ4079277.1 glycosyl hydrolase family 18 protein [Streptomyces humicola]
MVPTLRRPWMAALAALAAAIACLAAPADAATGAASAASARTHAAPAISPSQHVVAYYQTQYDNGSYVSPTSLSGIATDIDVAAFHLDSDGTVHLNDDPPSAAKFAPMWSDLAALQQSGVHVEAMLGGAAQGTYANLHNDFNTYYPLLRDTLKTYHFDGVDLDIEETFSLADTEHLITQLRADFGNGFIITMAPVATDLSGGSTFSGGFDYRTLESDMGSQINWYNAQFYCGWGDLSSTTDYDSVVANGFSPSRVVTGAVTNSANCSGYVDPTTLADTVRSLVGEHPDFAGVAGWEYFNAVGVNGGGPASWYQNVRDAMG